MTGLIILAAGQSSRLGYPKQNVKYSGRTLLQRAVEAAIACVCEPVIVVLGANFNQVAPTISSMPVHLVLNDDWPEGMASSIHRGIKELERIAPEVAGTVLMLCDQPFVNAELLNALVQQAHDSDKEIVASAYNDTIGPPALFSKTWFQELLLLKGQEGAKKILVKHQQMVVSIPFPLGAIDIDTAEDQEQLNS